MTTSFRPLVAVVLLPLLTACGGEGARPDPQAVTLSDTLSSLIASAYDFETPGTLERMIDLYAEGDSVISASGGVVTVSADSVRSGITRFWELAGKNMRNAEWQWREVHVQRLSDDAAVLTGSWSLPHIALDNQPHVIEGAWTAVFRRIGGKWKIVHEHLSAPLEEPETVHDHP